MTHLWLPIWKFWVFPLVSSRCEQESLFSSSFFCLRGRFPSLPWDFLLYHNDPAARQDHCGRCRIRTQELCPRSLVLYQATLLRSTYYCYCIYLFSASSAFFQVLTFCFLLMMHRYNCVVVCFCPIYLLCRMLFELFVSSTFFSKVLYRIYCSIIKY